MNGPGPSIKLALLNYTLHHDVQSCTYCVCYATVLCQIHGMNAEIPPMPLVKVFQTIVLATKRDNIWSAG